MVYKGQNYINIKGEGFGKKTTQVDIWQAMNVRNTVSISISKT